MSAEYSETGMKMPRRGRGKAKRSLDLIEAMHAKAKAAQPITGRGIGYKLFTNKPAPLISSMGNNDMQRVYRLLKEAREDGTIPWEWIVDETRKLERRATWDNPEEYMISAHAPIGWTSGTSNPTGSKSGPRREPSVACLPPCSTDMQ